MRTRASRSDVPTGTVRRAVGGLGRVLVAAGSVALLFTAYELFVTDWARERARQIVLDPPLPWIARPLLETVNFVTIALLPERVREQYRFSPLPPVFVRKALVAGGAEYVKRAVIPFLPDRLRLVPDARAA